MHVMSGAAVEPGLLAAAEAFRKETATKIKITFATAPEIRRRVGASEMPDVVIAPPAVLDELAKSGRLDGTTRVLVGRVGVGVAVRNGAPKPDISTTDALKRAIIDADSIIYNRASSGLFVEGLLQRLGLAELIQAKTRRYSARTWLSLSSMVVARRSALCRWLKYCTFAAGACSSSVRCRRKFKTIRATPRRRYRNRKLL